MKKEKYVSLNIYSEEENDTLIKALKILQSEISKRGLDIEFNLHIPYHWSDWEREPLRAEIKMSSSPVPLINYLHMACRGSSNFYFIVEVLNNVYSDDQTIRYYSPDLRRGFGDLANLCFAFSDSVGLDTNDISDCKILNVKRVSSTHELGEILKCAIDKALTWSPFKDDGENFVFGLHNPERYFGKLIRLRESTSVDYTNKYIEMSNGLDTYPSRLISCKDLCGNTAAIDVAKIASMTPDTSIMEKPGVRIQFYDKRQMADGTKILDPMWINVETTSFFKALLGIKDFPPMPIHRVMPELENDNLPESIQLEKIDFPSEVIDYQDFIKKVKSEPNEHDVEENDDEELDFNIGYDDLEPEVKA